MELDFVVPQFVSYKLLEKYASKRTNGLRQVLRSMRMNRQSVILRNAVCDQIWYCEQLSLDLAFNASDVELQELVGAKGDIFWMT